MGFFVADHEGGSFADSTNISGDVEVEFRVAIIHTPQCKAGLYLPSNIKVPLRQIWQTNISAPPKTLNLKNTYFVDVGGGGRVFYIQFQS